MSYITAQRVNKKVLIWSRGESKLRECSSYDVPWYCYTKDPEGTFKDIYGNNLIKHEFKTKNDFDEFKNNYITYSVEGSDITINLPTYNNIKKEDSNRNEIDGNNTNNRHKQYFQKTFLYESDIQPELKILSEKFYKVPAAELYITGYDIEVDYDPEIGFPRPVMNFDPEDYHGNFERKEGTPYAPINAIAIYNFWENKNYLIAIPPNELDANDINVDQFYKELETIEPLDLPTTLEFVNSEAELLRRFLTIIDQSDLIFGWNSDTFDNPYIAQRIEIVLNQSDFKRLSFRECSKPKYQKVEKFGEDVPTISFQGRVATDYLEIYKKCTFTLQPSYKLESIAELELPKMRKLEYDGTLYELYRKDFTKFVRYNIRDTEILFGFEQKLGFISLLNDMYHDFTGLFKHTFGTIAGVDLALINYCHHEFGNIIVPDSNIENLGLDEYGNPIKQEAIDGAYVLDTIAGMYDNMASVDITSLYPKTIESNNISPETIIGQFVNTKSDFQKIKQKSNDLVIMIFDKNHKTYPNTEVKKPANEWPDIFIKMNWSISGYGTVFSLNKKGILPSLLSNWFNIRSDKKAEGFRAFHDSEKILDKYR